MSLFLLVSLYITLVSAMNNLVMHNLIIRNESSKQIKHNAKLNQMKYIMQNLIIRNKEYNFLL